ncbi:MAG: hypothetical protein PHG29_06510 [Prolixibacteraceae bacterium]|nr:hypothetical protein [Bacteroidales bacterium]MDD4755716.1 hypothetical protein [Prolixibacteraceae bacterium]
MKKVKISLLLISLLVFQGSLLAQSRGNQTIRAKYAHSLGVAAGETTGYGISYRYWPEKFGVQGTFSPYSDEWGSNYSVGVSLLYKIVQTEKVNFFLYQGNHYLYTREKYDNNDYEIVNNHFNNGIGFGVEFIILKRVSLNLMGGYAGFENFRRIGFTGETGLYFMF